MNTKFQEIPEIVKKCIANVFSHKLHTCIGAENMEEVVKLNTKYNNKGLCASKIYCEANVLLVEAFKETGIRNLFTGNQDERDADYALMSEVWQLAKENNFQPIKI